MKLKYYLRGLGIGIIVTAVVMGVAVGKKTEIMTDEQVKARAVELGMIEDTFLADAVKTMEATKEALSEKPSEELTAEQGTKQVTGEPVTEPMAEPSTKPVTEQASKPDIKPAAGEATDKPAAKITDMETKTGAEKEMLEITVASGESSVSISRKLEQAGLVESASEYDRYLSQNGYDKKICTGTHMIAEGATKEEIAKEITTR